jgi:prepilin-type N-terminal cleavage/methylation domain-containing protein
MNIRIKTRNGFTIVELLIVIVVIGILAAITIVSFNGITERARIAKAQSFEHSLIAKYSIDKKGQWSFDECSGNQVSDGMSATKDTIAGTPNWITSTPTGKGCALRLDGSTRIDTQATIGSSYYVKAAWVKLAAGACAASNYNILSGSSVGSADAAFYMPSCKPAAGHNGYWSFTMSSTALNDGKWHYIAAIWEGGTMNVYVDGTTVATSTSAVPAPSDPNGLIGIGEHAGANNMLGDIDNVFFASQ